METSQQQQSFPNDQTEPKNHKAKKPYFVLAHMPSMEKVFAYLVPVCAITIGALFYFKQVTAVIDVIVIAITFAVTAIFLFVRNASSHDTPTPTVILLIVAVIFSAAATQAVTSTLSRREPEQAYFHVTAMLAFTSQNGEPLQNKEQFAHAAVYSSNSVTTIIPIAILMQLDIANLQSFTSNLVRMNVYRSDSEYGPWLKLCRVSLTRALLALQIPPNGIAHLLEPQGANLDILPETPIPSHDSKKFWGAWACPKDKKCTGLWVKIELADDSGAKNVQLLDLQSGLNMANIGSASFRIGSGNFDFKNRQIDLICRSE